MSSINLEGVQDEIKASAKKMDDLVSEIKMLTEQIEELDICCEMAGFKNKKESVSVLLVRSFEGSEESVSEIEIWGDQLTFIIEENIRERCDRLAVCRKELATEALKGLDALQDRLVIA